MKVEQIYTGCLTHAAYYIENNGEATIFDPLREVAPYLQQVQKENRGANCLWTQSKTQLRSSYHGRQPNF